MNWIKQTNPQQIPMRSWCPDIEETALKQIRNLAMHPVVRQHVAVMPDCHAGLGMPIGGVIAVEDAVIPSAVGVDIGCGMVAVETDVPAERFAEMPVRRAFLEALKERIPVGEGVAHHDEQDWDGFAHYLDSGGESQWVSRLDRKNLGTLGGGNHFAELQKSDAGFIWMMIHSGSRNLGNRVERFYHARASKFNQMFHTPLPDEQLAFLPVEAPDGSHYLRDMAFALRYAQENRTRMMAQAKEVLARFVPEVRFLLEVNIHHNYAAKETHFGKDYWIHRKGATSAKLDELGIIPGSMGTASYIVRGLGNPGSFMSCSHGAGRVMSRTKACQELTPEACDAALEGVAYDRWKPSKPFGKKTSKTRGALDLSEAPQAYKPIDDVIAAELDLIEPLTRLMPLAVLKG
jgi:tRNA-splicing ligase RtcB